MCHSLIQTPIALITGSTRGLGFETAKLFDEKKVFNILTGRFKTSLEMSSKNLQHAHLIYPIDFLKKTQLKKFLNDLVKKKLFPNILIHNLGGKLKEDHFPLDCRTLRDSINFNLEISILINNFFLPYMQKKKYGRIIHIGSDASLTGKASPSYVVSKAALNGYIKAAARFYAKDQIMFCGILPGIFEHQGSVWEQKKNNSPQYYKSKIKETALGRFGTPKEIATLVTHLALSKSMMCSGSLFTLTGGN